MYFIVQWMEQIIQYPLVLEASLPKNTDEPAQLFHITCVKVWRWFFLWLRFISNAPAFLPCTSYMKCAVCSGMKLFHTCELLAMQGKKTKWIILRLSIRNWAVVAAADDKASTWWRELESLYTFCNGTNLLEKLSVTIQTRLRVKM